MMYASSYIKNAYIVHWKEDDGNKAQLPIKIKFYLNHSIFVPNNTSYKKT